MKRRLNSAALVSAAALVASVYAAGSFFEPKRADNIADAPPGVAESARKNLHPDAFDGIQFSAKSAAVVDLRNGAVMFGHNEKAQLPLASLAKLVTLAALPNDQKGDQEDSRITISENSLTPEGDSGLRPGEKWNLASLMALTLVSSSNDGAYALAGNTKPEVDDFIARMNEKAKEFGLEQTYFLNSTGLDQGPGLGGAYGSALDMVRLITEVLKAHPEILEATRYTSVNIPREDGVEMAVRNTNASVERLPGIIASKTGFTDAAGGNLVVVIEAGPGRPIGIAVLGASPEGRFSDVETLAWAALREIGKGE